MNNTYSQNLLDSTKKSTTDVIKTASKRAILKTAEATVDLNGNEIADKITIISKSLIQNYLKRISFKNRYTKRKIYISRK